MNEFMFFEEWFDRGVDDIIESVMFQLKLNRSVFRKLFWLFNINMIMRMKYQEFVWVIFEYFFVGFIVFVGC